jgi:NhaA family Na+:H+ antiporter
MVGPAAVYLALNAGPGGAVQGWPIDAASDMALALAALALVGRGLPEALRLFVLTLAITGVAAAVALSAILFTGHVHAWPLVGAALTLAALIGLSEWTEAPFLFRVLGFLALGAFTLKSGINTALAGFAAALTVPIGPRRPDQDGVLKHFMESVHPYVVFGVLPLFAFTAAGVRLADTPLAAVVSPIALGVAAGLVVGKPAGMLGATWLMVRSGLARRPTGAAWLDLLGVALLCGVGLSMSLYVGALAFPQPQSLQRAEVAIGALAGSLVSGLAGIGVLTLAAARREAARPPRD